MEQPARHREKAGKLYLPAIQRWASEQLGSSLCKRGQVEEQVTVARRPTTITLALA
jgi:hypothetical protein